jgi:polysaccharide biosynthesis protein PslG
MRTISSCLAIFACSAMITAAMAAATPSENPRLFAQFGYRSSPISFTLRAPATVGPIAATYFGLHIYNLAAVNPTQPGSLTPFPPFSFRTFRLWDVTPWAEIESSPGFFNWAKLDGTIKTATANGVTDFVFTFGHVPPWASSNPGGTCISATAGSCYPPAKIADFDSFATHLVQRYCGVIQYYETWNEPSIRDFWAGTNAQLLTLTQHLYRIVKDPANCGCAHRLCSPGGGENPNKILLPSINTAAQSYAQQWLKQWLVFVGNPYPYADIATFHGYGYTADPEDIYQGVAFMRATLAQFGLGKAELWNTEASWSPLHTPATQTWQASWLMRYQIIQAAAGVSRFIWYAYDNCSWGTLWGPACGATPDSWTGIRAPGTAYSVVEEWLTGASVQYCEAHADGLWACRLTRSNGYVAWAVWNGRDVTVNLHVPAGWGLAQYRDWQNHKQPLGANVSVGQMPVLLENKDGF